MSRAIIHSTQVCVTLALNIQVQHNHEARLMSLPLVPVTPLFFTLLSVGQSWSRFRFEVATLAADSQEAIGFAGKVLTIGFKALAFGLGVSL